jgi:hypothetical protein
LGQKIGRKFTDIFKFEMDPLPDTQTGDDDMKNLE